MELIEDLGDMSVDVSRPGLAQFVSAKAPGLDAQASETCRSSGSNVPNAVTDGKGVPGVDSESFHRSLEDFGARFGFPDVVRCRLAVDEVVSVIAPRSISSSSVGADVANTTASPSSCRARSRAAACGNTQMSAASSL